MRDCENCARCGRDGCKSWNCDFVPRKEAVEAWKEKHEAAGHKTEPAAFKMEHGMNDYSVGEYIIYQNSEKYELGRIKSLREDGAFVAYHEGEAGALTPYSHMHKLINGRCIVDTSLGGDFFKEQG